MTLLETPRDKHDFPWNLTKGNWLSSRDASIHRTDDLEVEPWVVVGTLWESYCMASSCQTPEDPYPLLWQHNITSHALQFNGVGYHKPHSNVFYWRGTLGSPWLDLGETLVSLIEFVQHPVLLDRKWGGGNPTPINGTFTTISWVVHFCRWGSSDILCSYCFQFTDRILGLDPIWGL